MTASLGIPGVLVGHWTDREAATGCTVVLCPEGAVAAVDVRGGAPGTRETDALRPANLVERAHAVLLTGGSAFGLDAAGGVARWLEERGHGFPVRTGVVPIVAAAVLFDLSIGRPDVRPGDADGYAACEAASEGPVEEGSVGAGTGATAAKAGGLERAIKGGLGVAREETAAGVAVAAVVAVNPFGEVVDPDTGRLLAGVRGDSPGQFLDITALLRTQPPLSPFAGPAAQLPTNSTIGAIVTDAALTKEQAARVAAVAQGGLARAIRPAFTPVDGDTLFVLATGANPAPTDALQLGALAARAVERAVVRAVTEAVGLAGIPSAAEWRAP
jgi:L-aminopeptidase/D-esterase-like protein